MKLLTAVNLLFIFLSCKSHTSQLFEEREIVFEGIKRDSVVVFLGSLQNNDTLNIFRKIEVVENKNTDTILLGYAIIPPGFKGSLFFIQDGLDKSKAIYIDSKTDLDPYKKISYAKLFTIAKWGQKTSKVLKPIKIKFSLRE